MQRFDYVWLASNGSRRKVMLRLAAIMDGVDYEEHEDDAIMPEHEDHLVVELSTDYFHDRSMVADDVWELWYRRAQQRPGNGFGLRDVTTSRSGVIAAGRAKRTGNYTTEKGCVCSDIVIEPDGTLKGCGCSNAPTLGTVFETRIPTDSWQWGECSNAEETGPR